MLLNQILGFSFLLVLLYLHNRKTIKWIFCVDRKLILLIFSNVFFSAFFFAVAIFNMYVGLGFVLNCLAGIIQFLCFVCLSS
jgi:hypothetical protein